MTWLHVGCLTKTKTIRSHLFKFNSRPLFAWLFFGNNNLGLCLTCIKAGSLPLSTSIISPPQAMIIKKRITVRKKNCDISNLCIELVVKEMSQRDLWSRGAAALLRECYPATGGVLCPLLGLCGQMWCCTSTKLSNMGRHSQQPWMLVDRPMIKIHYNFLQSLVQEVAWEPHIEHIHMTNLLAIYANVEHNFITNK